MTTAPLLIWLLLSWMMAPWQGLAPTPGGLKGYAGGGGGISFDASSGTTATAQSSLTWSHTCTGANLALFVSAAYAGDTPTITGVTYNSVAMTQVWQLDASGGVVARSSGWILVNPATGTHNIVVTYSPAGAGYNAAAATSWTGVNQTTPNRTATTGGGGGGSNPATLTVSNSQSGDVVVDGVVAYASNTMAANHNSRVSQLNLETSNYSHGTQSFAATGSATMTWTPTSDFWTMGAIPLIPQ